MYRNGGKKIIIATVQKLPFILDDIGNAHCDGNFAIIIDEAHSGQGRKTAGALSRALGDSGNAEEDEDTFEDKVHRIIEGRRLLSNASYFAFTATPKNMTLELFGAPAPQPDGAVKHLRFRGYTMKQAIEEGFITTALVMSRSPCRTAALLPYRNGRSRKSTRNWLQGTGLTENLRSSIGEALHPHSTKEAPVTDKALRIRTTVLPSVKVAIALVEGAT